MSTLEAPGPKYAEWGQGDFALDVGPFLFGDQPTPTDEDQISASFESIDPPGFVVVSQTCDIVSSVEKLPYVAVCPLVHVKKEHLDQIAKGTSPRFALITNAPEGLVADLGKPMSVSKELLASWQRYVGFPDPDSALNFARGLERAFGRFAFPNDFNNSIKGLAGKIKEKYARQDSPLGKSMRSIEEIRVRPSADWYADRVQLTFLLVFAPKERRELDPDTIESEFLSQLQKLSWKGAFELGNPAVRIDDYDGFSARDYIESVPLDLNALSFAARFDRSHLASAEEQPVQPFEAPLPDRA